MCVEMLPWVTQPPQQSIARQVSSSLPLLRAWPRSRVPLHDPEDEERQESWCLGYAFCTLKRNSDLKRALKVLQVSHDEQ
ncbi:hypothetical protein DUNSADRAFT_11231 [Dunaliella salina]|uniref:Encoded protein n=1 Tax=Dunaliella salina TaxID=3046 RepID=A0ABQ7GDU1_DUNSA|nr:hypothetical protein DUNSADRAFT_11231 [Dunaliella salina]|eukprot:KAF5832773.1 hypothetical protein DUNSADRAFT_11231 [Dunaliella salina]